MQLERIMEYAIRLADPEFQGEGEDISKLASLVDEVARYKPQEAKVRSGLQHQFQESVKAAFRNNGQFRQELEQFPEAKRFISAMQ